VGDGAIIAAGSTITGDVPADGLSFGRARQTDIPDGASRFRASKGHGTDSR
jgi:bifunctional UDP-N-acetylglucosamine pyrophosphorylase/glucosamine-1-phosphate N-acetyltransferase